MSDFERYVPWVDRPIISGLDQVVVMSSRMGTMEEPELARLTVQDDYYVGIRHQLSPMENIILQAFGSRPAPMTTEQMQKEADFLKANADDMPNALQHMLELNLLTEQDGIYDLSDPEFLNWLVLKNNHERALEFGRTESNSPISDHIQQFRQQLADKVE